MEAFLFVPFRFFPSFYHISSFLFDYTDTSSPLLDFVLCFVPTA